MSEDTSSLNISLKRSEPKVSSKQPWGDDELGSEQFAKSLTALVSNETGPLTISLDGYWGIGKTFLLKRWQKDLENKKFKSIYFNAWEDDFCADPLVAIIGQLSNSFQIKGYKRVLNKVTGATKLLIPSAISGVLKIAGIEIPEESWKKLRDLAKDSSLEEYLAQIKKKEDLKGHLKELSAKVKEKTGQPLVFIVDELDRCRPTFAIELLERVKHIFDIPNIIFVFGVNRKELLSALESVYGDIESDVYLRRFFDMGFLLPETDSELFCRYLIKDYRLDEFFSELSKQAKSSVHQEEFQQFSEFFPRFCRCMDLSLRDIDYCVRAMVFAAKNVKKKFYIYPHLTSVLIVLRLKNPDLYLKFITEKCVPIKIIDYLDEEISIDNKMHPLLDTINLNLNLVEAYLYLIHENHFYSSYREDVASPLGQLKRLQQSKREGINLVTNSGYLSDRIKKADKQVIDSVMDYVEEFRPYWERTPKIDYILKLIELVAR